MRCISMALSLTICILVGSAYSLAGTGDACADLPPATWNDARVDNIDLDRQTITLTDCRNDRRGCEGTSKTLTVGAALRSEVKVISQGDHVAASFDLEEKHVPAEKPDKKDISTPVSRSVKNGGAAQKDQQDNKDQKGKANDLKDISTPSDAAGSGSNRAKEQLPELKSIRLRCAVTSDSKRYWTLVLVLAVMFLIATVVTAGRPFRLIIGEDGKYSNSKTQMGIWFWIVISSYVATVYLRLDVAGWDLFGNVNIATNLLLISGMSAITFGTAKAITTQKAQDNPGAKPQQNPSMASLVTDLTQNDAGQFDLGDVQMLIVTFVAVAMYVTSVLHFLSTIQFLKTVTLPDVDTTILAMFGLGHGAYLAKKAGGQVGKS
jgi:hypothetical protein